MSEDAPRINEIINLLSKNSPATLEQLRRAYPDAESAKILRAGEMAGGRTDKQTRLRAEAAVAGLDVAVRRCEQLIPAIKGRMRGGNRLQFAGQLLTVVGGASIFGLLALDYPRGAKYTAAILTLLGAVSSLYAEHIGRALHTAAGSLFDLYRKLVECHLRARQLMSELKPWVESNFSGPSKEHLVAQANEVCYEIIKVESEVP
ncbi:MAG: hypothetical protein JOZ96_05915 [Acidobacteria bacterium]|nr:hypothetical protein [Acidobacteriota bacterium]